MVIRSTPKIWTDSSFVLLQRTMQLLSVAQIPIFVNVIVNLRHVDYNECKKTAPTKNSPFHTKIHPFKKRFLCVRIKMLPSKKQLRSGKYEEVLMRAETFSEPYLEVWILITLEQKAEFCGPESWVFCKRKKWTSNKTLKRKYVACIKDLPQRLWLEAGLLCHWY